jgi:protein-L-isoaspartate(D-aspartate) O-methyltransferase
MNTRKQLIEHLEENMKVLRAPEIKKAFEKIDRADFVLEDYKEEAYEDYPLPIGFEQTISQPTTVAFMLELLDVKPNSNVLDVGSGSGYTTAILASIVTKGNVLGLEIIPELAQMGKINIAKYKFSNAKIEYSDSKSVLIADFKKFDRILVNAAAEEVPENLLGVLKPGGIMVIPIKHSLFKVHKKENGEIESTEYPGFAFVELK